MLKKIHIFKTGNYGESEARKWNNEEVKQLANNYDFNYRRAMVKLGHDGFFDSEKPAVGWVKSLEYKEDENGKGNLYANVEFNDNEIDNIKDKYINVSVEVTKAIGSYDQETDKRGAYLLGIALLGSSQPAVPGLDPVKFSKNGKDENFIITGLNDKSETFFNFKKNDTIQKKGANMQDLKELQAELEKFKKEKAELDKKLQEYAEKDKKAQITAMVESYNKKIAPAVKENLAEFAMSLDETQIQAFKKILKKMPELSVFKNADMPDEEPENKKVSKVDEALKDLQIYQQLNKGV